MTGSHLSAFFRKPRFPSSLCSFQSRSASSYCFGTALSEEKLCWSLHVNVLQQFIFRSSVGHDDDDAAIVWQESSDRSRRERWQPTLLPQAKQWQAPQAEKKGEGNIEASVRVWLPSTAACISRIHLPPSIHLTRATKVAGDAYTSFLWSLHAPFSTQRDRNPTKISKILPGWLDKVG